MTGGDGDGAPFQYGRVEGGMVEPDFLSLLQTAQRRWEGASPNGRHLAELVGDQGRL